MGGGLTGLNRDPTYSTVSACGTSLVEASSQPTANIWLRRRRAMNFTKIVSTGQEHISNYILVHAMFALRVGRGIVLRPA